MLPSTLKSIDSNIFAECNLLKVVWVEDCYTANIRSAVGDHVLILRKSKVGGRLLWNLRKQSKITITDGVEYIGNYWFANSEIESVRIPASVKSLGTEVFRSCKKLRCVELAPESRLKVIEERCFSDSGIEQIALPKTVERVGKTSF